MSVKCIRCRKCNTEFVPSKLNNCPSCNGILEIIYDYDKINLDIFFKENIYKDHRMWQYKDLLPLADESNIVSLGEGGTPLIAADNLNVSDKIKCQILLKLESQNPSGSFKDRPTSVAISKAKELQAQTVIVSSSGNAAASTSAYAVRASMKAVICLPQSTDINKVSQAITHGAQVVYIEGSVSDSFNMVKKASEFYGWPNITSTFINPYTVEGDKTVAYELWKQMDSDVPDVVIIPIGAGPLLVGIHKGFQELKYFNLIKKIPRLVGVQAARCSPIFKAYLNKQESVNAWLNPINTIATGIADPLVGYEQDGLLTLQTILKSGGCVISLEEDEINASLRKLSRNVGVYAEPTAATPIGALKKLVEQKVVDSGEKVVCIITGHGLKYKDTVDYQPPVISSLEELKTIIKGSSAE